MSCPYHNGEIFDYFQLLFLNPTPIFCLIAVSIGPKRIEAPSYCRTARTPCGDLFHNAFIKESRSSIYGKILKAKVISLGGICQLPFPNLNEEI